MAPKYKLTYFNGKGRGEVSRLLFTFADVKFEDKRIEFSDWPALKPKVPIGSLPVLEIDGKVQVSQSLAIARFLAREFKLYGRTNLDQVYVDQLVDTIVDLQLEGFKAAFAKEEEKAELAKKMETETCPKYLGIIEKLIGTSGKAGFTVGGTNTLSDFVLFSCLENLKMSDDVISKFPLITAVKKKLMTNPRIANYLKNRPETF